MNNPSFSFTPKVVCCVVGERRVSVRVVSCASEWFAGMGGGGGRVTANVQL